ncbi:alkaline phosphatase [Candidatus Caldatribacterium sp. SIUC1]|uniref:alkaline phosphatase n=1 Tax=Candidatus Caldatribacterium sp. SIUC1 TaxID=3418365 RepID=UPI003F691D5B
MGRYVLLFLLLLALFLPSLGDALPRYVFLFIADGLGQEEIDLYMALAAARGRVPAFVDFPIQVFLDNRTAQGGIPDSASAATSIACGVKVPQGVLGVDSQGRPLESVAEAAKNQGFQVGIVTNVAVNDATPAAFYAHVPSRKSYDDIAQQLVESGFDLFVGSGITSSGEAARERVLALARKRGYRVIQSPAAFFSLKPASLPVIALLPFTFAIDRKDPALSLASSTQKAIELLQDSSGFFLVVEGGRIDWCNHANDIASSLAEVEDFEAAIRVALSFGKAHLGETLILVTSDHDTGGLTFRENPFPRIPPQAFSYERFLAKLRTTPKKEEALFALFTSTWGEETLQGLEEELSAASQEFLLRGNGNALWIRLARLLAEREGLSWATTGHTACPVPLYAWGESSQVFQNARSNTDIAKLLKALLREQVVPEEAF